MVEGRHDAHGRDPLRDVRGRRVPRHPGRLGTLEPGKLADLIAVTATRWPTSAGCEAVRFVMKEGVVFTRTDKGTQPYGDAL
jgi:cytosine/adenosine deaminase-related metal-dependent hydrolase